MNSRYNAADGKERINWLSILRGMTIALVVMNHVRLLNASTGECYQFIYSINDCFVPLRMPTFIMVSGALLFYSRISRGWKTLLLYKDKLLRIGLPLLFCTVLGNVMQMLFNSFVKNPHEVGITSFLKSFVLTQDMPWPHRWYLMTLMLIMMLYPLFIIRKTKTQECILLALLFIVRDIDLTPLCDNNWFGLFTVNKFLPYFYMGLIAFKYRWYRYLASKMICGSLILLYVLAYVIGKEFIDVESFISIPVFEILGTCMIVSVSMQIDRFAPRTFKSFSGYIFQIYLFGIAFQAFVELILWRMIGCPDVLVSLAYVVNVLAGIYLPVAMSKVIEKVPLRWVRYCFGLK